MLKETFIIINVEHSCAT